LIFCEENLRNQSPKSWKQIQRNPFNFQPPSLVIFNISNKFFNINNTLLFYFFFVKLLLRMPDYKIVVLGLGGVGKSALTVHKFLIHSFLFPSVAVCHISIQNLICRLFLLSLFFNLLSFCRFNSFRAYFWSKYGFSLFPLLHRSLTTTFCILVLKVLIQTQNIFDSNMS
jgi:hypothetical protein